MNSEKSLNELLLEIANLNLLSLKKNSNTSPNILNTPFGLAILGAIVTALLALLNNYLQFQTTAEDQRQKLESSLILKAMEGDSDLDRQNTLVFLIEAGLIRDSQNKIRKLSSKGVPQLSLSPTETFINKYELGHEEGFKNYIDQARTNAETLGIKTDVGLTILSDTLIQQGRNRLMLYIEESNKEMQGTPKSGVSEKNWLLSFLKFRKSSYDRHSESLRRSLNRRVDDLTKQVNEMAEQDGGGQPATRPESK